MLSHSLLSKGKYIYKFDKNQHIINIDNKSRFASTPQYIDKHTFYGTVNRTMVIDACDYNIIQNNIPVLTRTGDGKYINTNCYLSNFYIESKNVKNILSGFDYKNNILDTIKQFGHSPRYLPVLYTLTNSNIQTSNFNTTQDVLAVALCLENKTEQKPISLLYFEVNGDYRRNVADTQKYKTVGGSMLTSLQKEYWNQGIAGRSTYDALRFYYKYNFTRMDDRELYLLWQPQR